LPAAQAEDPRRCTDKSITIEVRFIHLRYLFIEIAPTLILKHNNSI
jgi:hypothetical protein